MGGTLEKYIYFIVDLNLFERFIFLFKERNQIESLKKEKSIILYELKMSNML